MRTFLGSLSVISVATRMAAAVLLTAGSLVSFSWAAEPNSGSTRGDRVARASATSPVESDRNVTKSRSKTETAVFAGGCFWCTELTFRRIKGVVDVESGYCGGTEATANYDKVHSGRTKHAEAIRVTYDPAVIRYEQLLDVFFDAHDPTQWKRQGDYDVGRQYRSSIFFADARQKQAAQAKIDALRKERVHRHKVVTLLEPLAEFYPAEAEHQDFARRFLYLPYIQGHAIPRACQAWEKHPELLKDGPQN